MFAIMHNIMDMETGHMIRDITIYSQHHNEFADTFQALSEFTANDEMLKCHSEVREKIGNSSYAHWRLHNDSVSRKKFEIVFRKFYS